MIVYESTITHTCDNCRKIVSNWDVHRLVDRYYTPGKNFDKCSSNIDAHTKKIVELCPECMQRVISSYTNQKKG